MSEAAKESDKPAETKPPEIEIQRSHIGEVPNPGGSPAARSSGKSSAPGSPKKDGASSVSPSPAGRHKVSPISGTSKSKGQDESAIAGAFEAAGADDSRVGLNKGQTGTSVDSDGQALLAKDKDEDKKDDKSIGPLADLMLFQYDAASLAQYDKKNPNAEAAKGMRMMKLALMVTVMTIAGVISMAVTLSKIGNQQNVIQREELEPTQEFDLINNLLPLHYKLELNHDKDELAGMLATYNWYNDDRRRRMQDEGGDEEGAAEEGDWQRQDRMLEEGKVVPEEPDADDGKGDVNDPAAAAEEEDEAKDALAEEEVVVEEEKAPDETATEERPGDEEEENKAEDSSATRISLPECESDGDCITRNGEACALLFANYETADVAEAGQYCSTTCNATFVDGDAEYYAECPPVSTLVECGYDEACDVENNERCIDMVLREVDVETADGFYCYDQAACLTEIDDVGRTLYLACDTVSNIVSCRNDGACEGDENLCVPYTLETAEGDLYGNYCAVPDVCYTVIRDAAQQLYIACPAASDLVPCDENGECATEGDECVPHTYLARDGTDVIHGDFCTAPDLCNTEIEDAGRTLLVACPPESTLTPCTEAAECLESEGFIECAPHILLDVDGSELGADGNYCAPESDCFQDIPDAGRTLYVSCTSISALTACGGDDECEGDGRVCAPHTFEKEDGTWSAAADDYCTKETDCFTELVDLGYTYYRACPPTSVYTACTTDAGCISSEVCAPFTYEGVDDKTRIHNRYCASLAWCGSTVIDEAVEVTIACPDAEDATVPTGTACSAAGDCAETEDCADILAIAGNGDTSDAGKFCTDQAQCFVDQVQGPALTFYAVCPETSALLACDKAFWTETCTEDQTCASFSWEGADDEWHIEGDYCVARSECDQPQTDLGREYTADCPAESELVACTPGDAGHAECWAQFDDNWICATFQVLQSGGSKGSKGSYCADEATTCTQESIVDEGQTLYPSCPVVSRLTVCSDDSACEASDRTAGQTCHEYWLQDADGPRSYDNSYCAAECGVDVPDIGRSLFVQCPGEQLVGCDPDGSQCDIDAGQFCRRYSYDLSAEVVASDYYCTAQETCDEVVSKGGRDVTMECVLLTCDPDDGDLDCVASHTSPVKLCGQYYDLSDEADKNLEISEYCTPAPNCKTEVDVDEFTYFVICPSQEKIEAQIKFDWTEAEFEEAGGEDSFRQNLADALEGVVADQIEVVGVREGSLIVDYQIVFAQTDSYEDVQAIADQTDEERQAVVAQKTQAYTELRAVYASPDPVLGAPILDAELDNLVVVTDGVVADSGTIITPTAGNQDSADGDIDIDDIKDFLCNNYFVGLHQKLQGGSRQTTYMEDCDLAETDDATFIMTLSGFSTSELSKLTFRRNEMKTHYMSFEAKPALRDLNLLSQHMYYSTTGQTTDADMQSIFFNDDPIFRVNINQLANVELKLRGEFHNRTNGPGIEGEAETETALHLYDAPGRINQIGFITDIPSDEESDSEDEGRRRLAGAYDEVTKPHYAMLRFNFYQIKNTYEYYSLEDAGKDLIILSIFLGSIVMGIFMMLFIWQFYNFFVQLGDFIIRKYKDADEWKKIQRYLTKFRKIHIAMQTLAQFKDILDEIDKFINEDYENMTYDKTSEMLQKMKIMDQKLPNIDDIEVQYSKFEQSQAEQARNAEIDAIIEKRATLGLGEIIKLVKERVSIFGVYQLYDTIEMNDCQLRAEIKIQNAKLEFLYQALAKRSSKRKK